MSNYFIRVFIVLITIISVFLQSVSSQPNPLPALFAMLLLLGVNVHCIANGDGVEEEAGRWRHIQLADQFSVVNGGKIESWTSFTS